MVVIIVTAIVLFVAVLVITGAITQLIGERKILRSFYDILFLTYFFRELVKRNLIEEVLRSGETLKVTRRILKAREKLISKPGTKIAYLFEIGGRTFEFQYGLKSAHKRLVCFFSDTEFKLMIKKNRVDVSFNDMFGNFICVSNENTISQSLWLLVDSESKAFENEKLVFCTAEEVKQTEEIINETKKLVQNGLT